MLQVQYPASYNPSVGWTSVPAGLMFDSEDFEAFRGDTAVPVNLFMTCHDLLQTAFFDTVCYRCCCYACVPSSLSSSFTALHVVIERGVDALTR